MTRRRLILIFCSALVLLVVAACVFVARPVEVFDYYTETRMLLAGAETRAIPVIGYQVHYYVMGPASGPPVVLIHGLGGRAEDWRNLAPFLSRAGYRVFLPDLVGYGQSERPQGFSYSIPDEASIVVGFLDTLGLKQVDLGGWSMGGWIVQRVAAEYPERVRRLMLFDSAGLAVRPDWNIQLFTPRTASELAQLDALLMPHPPHVPWFVSQDILRVLKSNAWVIHRAMASMLTGRATTDDLLPSLKMPVLIVWGQLDQITPLNQGETMHRLIPQSRLAIIPECGHLAPSMCASQVGPVVAAFLR